MGMNVRKLRRLAAKVRPEYAPCMTEDCPDGERTDRVKWIMENRIPKRDRDLLLLYADRQSLREVARELGCCHDTIRNNLVRIRARIADELDKLTQ